MATLRSRFCSIPQKDYASRKLVDTSGEKFENSPGLKRWATIENLKIAAASYNEAGSIAELKRKISLQTQAGKSAKQSVVELEHRIKDLREIIKYAEQYKANRAYHIGYKKAKNPDAFRTRYRITRFPEQRKIANPLILFKVPYNGTLNKKIDSHIMQLPTR